MTTGQKTTVHTGSRQKCAHSVTQRRQRHSANSQHRTTARPKHRAHTHNDNNNSSSGRHIHTTKAPARTTRGRSHATTITSTHIQATTTTTTTGTNKQRQQQQQPACTYKQRQRQQQQQKQAHTPQRKQRHVPHGAAVTPAEETADEVVRLRPLLQQRQVGRAAGHYTRLPRRRVRKRMPTQRQDVVHQAAQRK